MKRITLAILALLLTADALAITDYQCMSDCTGHGYSYGYCSKICEY